MYTAGDLTIKNEPLNLAIDTRSYRCRNYNASTISIDSFMAVTYSYRYRDSGVVHDYLCNELNHSKIQNLKQLCRGYVICLCITLFEILSWKGSSLINVQILGIYCCMFPASYRPRWTMRQTTASHLHALAALYIGNGYWPWLKSCHERANRMRGFPRRRWSVEP